MRRSASGVEMRGSEKERQAKEQALCRRLNEEIDRVAEPGRIGGEMMLLACECPRGCGEQIEVPHHEYEATRAHSLFFLVLDGHESPEVDEVVARRGRYVVVRKAPGTPATVAAETDPRS